VYLPAVMQGYNSTVSVATGYTPYFAMFGHEMRTPSIVELEEELDVEWMESLSERLSLAWSAITERAYKNAQRQNRGGSQRRKDWIMVNRETGEIREQTRIPEYKEYEAGELFYLKSNPQRTFKSVSDKEEYKITRKLMSRYEGPYAVVKRMSAVVYKCLINGEEKMIHAINMKPDITIVQPSRPIQVRIRGEVRRLLDRAYGPPVDIELTEEVQDQEDG